MSKDGASPLPPVETLTKCKHGIYGLCTKCAYQNTGRRQSTDSFVDSDVVEFMESSMNKQLRSLYD